MSENWGGQPPQQYPQQQGGWGPNPPQYQQPQQQWGQQPGVPQGPPQGQWGQQQAPAAAPPSEADFFAGGGIFGPSFKFIFDPATGQGNGLIGTIVSKKFVPKTQPGNPVQQIGSDGKPLWQQAITLQTELRGWNGLGAAPTTKVNGVDLAQPPESDTGLRTVYLWYTSRDAVTEAVRAAGRDPQLGLEEGATLGLKVVGTQPNPKGGNPIKLYQAVYASPGAAPQQAPQQQAPQGPPPQQHAPAPQQPQGPPPVQHAEQPPF